MKILHVITTIERGGAETQLVLLASAQVKYGHQVEIVFLKDKPDLIDEFTKAGVQVHSHVAESPWLSKIQEFRYLVRNNFDIIHAHLPLSEVLSAIFVRKHLLIITRHNTEKILRGRFSFLSPLIAKYIEKRAHWCIAISNSVRTFMIENHEWNNPRTISTIYYAADPALRPYPMRSISSPLRFLTISRLVSQKDIPTMLRAMALNKVHHPFDTLTIVGDGRSEYSLRRLSRDLELEGQVIWHGKTDNISHAFSNAEVFLLSSRYEGFGLVLLEAMAFGRPILAAANKAVLEVLGDDYPGLFPVGDADALGHLLHKVHDFDFRRKLNTMLQNRLKLFSIEKTLTKLNVIYSSNQSISAD